MGLAWQYYCNLIDQGRATDSLMATCFAWSCRQVASGREQRAVKHDKCKDVYSQSKLHGEEIARDIDWELFVDPYSQDVPTIVSCRLDTVAWLATLSETDRLRAFDLATGERTKDIAERWGVSAPAVSQTRNKLTSSYSAFMHD
jgi:hypothetical protein